MSLASKTASPSAPTVACTSHNPPRKPSTTPCTSATSTDTTQADTASFGTLNKIDAGLLAVGYAEAGLAHGPAGRSCCTAGPTTSTATSKLRRCSQPPGYRVIVPYLRGYGTTRFLSADTPRNGQQAVVAVDIIALMDALKIEQGDLRRLRLGRTDGRYRRGAVAATLQRRWSP